MRVPTDGLCFGTVWVFTAGMSICWKHSSLPKNLLSFQSQCLWTRHQLKRDRKWEQECFGRNKKKNTLIKLGGGQMRWGFVLLLLLLLIEFLAKKKNEFVANDKSPSLFWYPAMSTSSCTICYQCLIDASEIIQQQSHCRSANSWLMTLALKTNRWQIFQCPHRTLILQGKWKVNDNVSQKLGQTYKTIKQTDSE